MNISDFKAALQTIGEKKSSALEYNTVSVSTFKGDTDFNIRDHVSQRTSYKLMYDYYDDFDSFNQTKTISKDIKTLMPKMLNWKKTEADYYIWLDGSMKFTTYMSVDWMINYFSAADETIMLFKHPSRANIIEEVDYIESEINAGNQEMIERYNLDELKSQVMRYIEDFPYLKTYPLFDTRAFIYKKDFIDKPRHFSNFMLDWFAHTVTESMNDKISLAYTLAYRRTRHDAFDGNLLTNNFIKPR